MEVFTNLVAQLGFPLIDRGLVYIKGGANNENQ